MPLANSIIPKRINVLGVFRFSVSVLLTTAFIPAFAQDNSPYSRYGLGDMVPNTNINLRGMGGVAAGINDVPSVPYSINFSNPASYSFFQSVKEAKSKKQAYGRAILDVGINLDNRTLIEPNNINKFGTSNLLFSHIQLGVPLRRNWGLVLGLRPVSRVSYKITSTERLINPNTGQSIDTAATLNQGDGGSYLPSIGTGYRFNIGKNVIAIGANVGYLFGSKDYSNRRFFLNDTVSYNAGNFQTKTTYGNLFYTGGLQYMRLLSKDYILTIGAFGNLSRDLKASQDITRETYFYDENQGNVRIDSVYEQNDIKGRIKYPSSYTVGFTLHKQFDLENKKGDWLVGVDFVQNKWDEYRSYGQADPTVRNNWQMRIGGEIKPYPKTNYFTRVAYRAGFFFGPDYIQVESKKLNTFGATLGLGLPIVNYNRMSPGQATVINLAFEFVKRGNNDNLLKENLFRISAGLSLSDFWFVKKKYD